MTTRPDLLDAAWRAGDPPGSEALVEDLRTALGWLQAAEAERGACNGSGEGGVMQPEIGDYVLATKYEDGDPGDNWALGFYSGLMTEYTPPRHAVRDSNGKSIRANGFRNVARIRKDVGRWLLEVAAPSLERSPPGTVNLWTMLTPAAFDVSDEDAN